jgi:hypothetical protein
MTASPLLLYLVGYAERYMAKVLAPIFDILCRCGMLRSCWKNAA